MDFTSEREEFAGYLIRRDVDIEYEDEGFYVSCPGCARPVCICGDIPYWDHELVEGFCDPLEGGCGMEVKLEVAYTPDVLEPKCRLRSQRGR